MTVGALLLLSYHGKSVGNQEADKILKLAENNISKSQVFAFLIKQQTAKFSSFSQYTSLKLIQLIISSVKVSQNG